MNSMRLRTQAIKENGTMERGGPPLQTSPIIGPEAPAPVAPDGDLVAAVIHVHKRVRARLRVLRGGGHAPAGFADPHPWDDAPGVLRRLGLQARYTAPVPSVRPLVTDAGDRAMLVDEVIDIALACLAALAASGAADAADWAGPAVKMHVPSAMNRLGAANRAHAAVLATQRRLL